MDTLDLRTDSTGQRVDLRPEGISDVYGLTGNLVIARDTLIEIFVAGSGNDEVIVSAAANHLQGRGGDDDLKGGSGDDVLEGGAGDDKLNGGPGDDTFVFAPEGGNNTITDFTDGDNSIDLSAFEDIETFNDLSLEQQGDNVVIDLSDYAGGTIVLSGFDLANLDAADFIL